MSEITVETATIELGYLNTMEIMQSWGGRAKWQHLVAKDKVGTVTIMDSAVKAVIRIV